MPNSNLDGYMNDLFGKKIGQWPQRPSVSASNAHGHSWDKTPKPPTGSSPAPTPSTPAAPSYSSKNPPPGFTSSQWSQLLSLGKNNSTLSNLLKQFTTSLSTPATSQAWRREMPKDNTQLLRQLSFNAGEMGMPGGYVGAVQMPAFGSSAQPVNNPDMATYGQQPGLGEATFFQQSMKGGMAPIAAMSPLGVPEGWNPGGSSSSDLKSQLESYLKNMSSSSSSRSANPLTFVRRTPLGMRAITSKPA